MDESPVGINFDVDFERYVRGCARLHWEPLPSEVFVQRYTQYWEAKRTIDRPRTWGFDPTRRRKDAANIVQQNGDLYLAVLSGMDSEGTGGTEDCGVTAPLLTGPAPRTGSHRAEIPVDFDAESAA